MAENGSFLRSEIWPRDQTLAQKNPAHKNLNPAKNELIPAQLGKFFGVQSGPILALWWPERATAEVENAKIFRAQGGAAPLEVPPVGNGGRPPRPAEKSDPL